jgi:hypothetical protein
MVDLAFLAKALADSEKAAQASNPYTTTNQVLSSINWNPNDFSTGENLAGGAVKGLLSGFFGGLGDNYVTGQKAQAMDLLGSLARGKEIARPDDMDLSVFAPLEQAGGLFALQQDLLEDEAVKQVGRDSQKLINAKIAEGLTLDPTTGTLKLYNPKEEKRKESTFTALTDAIAKNPNNAAKTIQAFKDAGLVDDADVKSITAIEQPQTPAESPSLFGGSTMSDKYTQELQKLLDQGVPAGTAAESAKALTAAERKGSEKSAERIQEIRERARSLSGLAQTALAGVEGAGNTGGFLGGIRDLASSAYAVVSPEEREQRASQGILESVAPDVLRASRQQGTGSTSDVEFKEYLKAGPTSSKTPEQNRAIIEKLENASKMESEYADFLDTFLAERGTLYGDKGQPSAEQLWEVYKKQNPLLIRDPKTKELIYNTERPSWREFDFAGALSGKNASKPSNQGASVPSVGGSFNGEKVIGVKRIG